MSADVAARNAALLAELAQAEAAYRAAMERRRQLVKRIMSMPAGDRPTITACAAAMGLPRASLHQLVRSSDGAR